MARNGTITRTFTDSSGKRHYFYGKTEAEAEQKKKEYIDRLRCGYTLEKWAYRALKTYRSGVSDATYQSYIDRLKTCIIPHFSGKYLKDITEADCQRCISAQNGKSQYTIDQTAQWLNFIFDKAVANHLIESNPASAIVKGKGTKTTHHALTESERQAFLLVAEDPIYLPYLIMYYTGCRPAELYRLTAADINGNTVHIAGTKTSASDRYVPLAPELRERLAGHTGTLARSIKGLPLNKERNVDLFRALKKDLSGHISVRSDFTPYDFRHDYCTRLARSGIDIRTAQYLMGHSTIEMTANIYTHIGRDDIEELYHTMYHAEPR